jgi:hypothetical protein
VQNDQLVNDVEYRRHDEYFAHGFPSITDKFPTMPWIAEEFPEVSRLSRSCVFQSVSHGEKSRNRWLDVKPHGQRAIRPLCYFLPNSNGPIIHDSSLLPKQDENQ